MSDLETQLETKDNTSFKETNFGSKSRNIQIMARAKLSRFTKHNNNGSDKHLLTTLIFPVFTTYLLITLSSTAQPQPKTTSAFQAERGNVLSRDIKHFEPLNYDHKQVNHRSRRDLSNLKDQSTSIATHPVKVDFHAHDTHFKLRLKPDVDSVFGKGAIIEDSSGNSVKNQLKDRLFSLSGHLEDQPYDTLVFGSLKNGIFEGRIHTNDSRVFYVEKARKYIEDLREHNEQYKNITSADHLNFHSVIYLSSDVTHPQDHDDFYHIDQMDSLGSICPEENAEVKQWLDRISKSADPGLNEENFRKSFEHLTPKEKFYARMEELYGYSFNTIHNQPEQYSHIDFEMAQTANKSDNWIDTTCEQHNRPVSRIKRQTDFLDLSMFGPKPRISHRPPQNEPAQRQKRACTLYIQTDSHLWNHTRKHHDNDLDTREEIASLVAQHIKAVNHIYENSDFGGVRGLKFIVQRLRINDTTACQGTKRTTNPFCSSSIDVSNFLNLNSQFNHNDFCLAYIFTYRDFSGGTLGLAWVASTSGASGGICEKYRSYTENVNGRQIQTKRSLNTGIITFVNYNSRVPPKVSELTLAHEIGHNFGSPHDFPADCRPGGPAGNFIMYSSATSGERFNNNKFSHCSIRNISAVLQTIVATDSKDNCFEVDNGPFCGNKIVEEGEECDCGYNAQECTEQCCVPREKSGDEYENLKSCHRIPGKQCSPSEGPCCSDECTFVGEEKLCRQETECSHPQVCNFSQASCPEPAPKPNMTECNNGTQVCMSGKCGGSICMKYGMEECFIQDTCEVACQQRDMPNTCRKTSDIPEMRHMSGLNLRPGSPCNNFAGFCDTFQKCRNLDPEGPLAKLKNLLFNHGTLMTIKQWAITHWWACALFAIGFIMLMYVFIECCAVHTPSSNPKFRPALKITETIRRPANTLRRKRRSHGSNRIVVSGGHRRPHIPGVPTGHHKSRHHKLNGVANSSEPRQSATQPSIPSNQNSHHPSSKIHSNHISSRQNNAPCLTPSSSSQPLVCPSNVEETSPSYNIDVISTSRNESQPMPMVEIVGRGEKGSSSDQKGGPNKGIIGSLPGLPRKHGWHNRRQKSQKI